MDNILEVKGLVKKFGDFVAVNNLSFSVRKGTIYALLGPNGAGKTTTLRMILGILKPTKGEILINGINLAENPEIAKKEIGYMPQYHSLYEDLSVYENLQFYANMYNMKDKHRLREILDFVELWEFRNRLVGHLSGGMKQRASLACALIHNPNLLILDEPTAGVDPVVRQKMWNYFENLKKEGKTILVTTHYMDEASKADVIHLIRNGKTMIIGSLDDVIDRMYSKLIFSIKLKCSESKIKSIKEVMNIEKIEKFSDSYKIFISIEKGSSINDILKKILGYGVEILEISTHKPSLEEAFVFYSLGGKNEVV